MDTNYHDVIHDLLLELDYEPTDEAIEVAHKMLPRSIKLEAEEWGWQDTCVKDEVYSWLEDNGSSFLE